jgi:hypothetical protein
MDTVKQSLFTLFIGLTIASCQSINSSRLITRHWKLTDVSGGRTSLLPDSLKSEFISTATLTFGPDNIVHYSGVKKIQYNGRYSLLSDELFTLTPQGSQKTDTNKIVLLTKTEFVFVDPLGNKFTYHALN